MIFANRGTSPFVAAAPVPAPATERDAAQRPTLVDRGTSPFSVITPVPPPAPAIESRKPSEIPEIPQVEVEITPAAAQAPLPPEPWTVENVNHPECMLRTLRRALQTADANWLSNSILSSCGGDVPQRRNEDDIVSTFARHFMAWRDRVIRNAASAVHGSSGGRKGKGKQKDSCMVLFFLSQLSTNWLHSGHCNHPNDRPP